MGSHLPKREERQGSPFLAKARSPVTPTDAQSLGQGRGKAQRVENCSVAFWKSQCEFSTGAGLHTESCICVPDAPEHGSRQLLLPFYLTSEGKKDLPFS